MKGAFNASYPEIARYFFTKVILIIIGCSHAINSQGSTRVRLDLEPLISAMALNPASLERGNRAIRRVQLLIANLSNAVATPRRVSLSLAIFPFRFAGDFVPKERNEVVESKSA